MLCVPGLARAAACDSLDGLDWLVGDWLAEAGKSAMHESWTRVAPGTFEGVAVERAKADRKVGGGESLRLVAMSGSVYYIAKVAHNEQPVAFRLTRCEQDRYVFENPSHDFPRRLEYARGGEGRLTVRVGDGSARAFTIDFVRAAQSANAPEAVLAAEDARFAAMIAGLPAGMQRWFAADLEYVHSTGEVENRDQLIDSIASGGLRYLAVEPGERRVTFLDEAAAVVQGPAHVRVSSGAGEQEFDIRYLAVYVLVDGAWQLHAWQSLRLP